MKTFIHDIVNTRDVTISHKINTIKEKINHTNIKENGIPIYVPIVTDQCSFEYWYPQEPINQTFNIIII